MHWFLCHDRLDCEYRVCLATCLSFLSCVYKTGGTAFPVFRMRFNSVGKSFGYGLRVRASRCPEDLRSSVFETQVGAISLRVLGGKKTSKARNLTSHPNEAWDLSLGFWLSGSLKMNPFGGVWLCKLSRCRFGLCCSTWL